MNIYKVIVKKKSNQPFWEDTTFMVRAVNFADAEKKAKNQSFNDGQIESISLFGDSTSDNDVIKMKGKD